MIDYGPAIFGAFVFAFKIYYPYIALFVLFVGLKLAFRVWLRRREQSRLTVLGIDDIDQLSGRKFEEYLEARFKQKGYHVELTPYQKDWGGDLVITKDGVRTAVQAKRWKDKVGVSAVREVFAAKETYRCTKAMVVTNGTYTDAAMKQAADCGVELWARERLLSELLALPLPTHAAPKVPTPARSPGFERYLAEHALAESPSDALLPPHPTDADPTVCAVCGKPLTPKVAAYCRAHVARFGGRGLCFDHQKTA